MPDKHRFALVLTTAVSSLITILISYFGRGLTPGRLLADPLPIVLSFGQIMRGFLYWNWRGPLFHLGFVVLLACLSLFLLRWQSFRGKNLSQLAGQVARLTAVVNIGVVAIQQVDAFIVGVYYLIGGLISTFIAGIVAEKGADLFLRQ